MHHALCIMECLASWYCMRVIVGAVDDKVSSGKPLCV